MEYVDVARFSRYVSTLFVKEHNFPGILIVFFVLYMLFRMIAWIRELCSRKVRLIFDLVYS